MSLTVQPVSLMHIHQTWPLVEPIFIKGGKEAVDEYSLDQIKTYLASGIWMLVVAVDEENKIYGVSTINFYNTPNHCIGFITTMAGKAIVNTEVYAQLCDLLKSKGATRIRCAARESAVRLYRRMGMKERHTIMETIL